MSALNCVAQSRVLPCNRLLSLSADTPDFSYATHLVETALYLLAIETGRGKINRRTASRKWPGKRGLGRSEEASIEY